MNNKIETLKSNLKTVQNLNASLSVQILVASEIGEGEINNQSFTLLQLRSLYDTVAVLFRKLTVALTISDNQEKLEKYLNKNQTLLDKITEEDIINTLPKNNSNIQIFTMPKGGLKI